MSNVKKMLGVDHLIGICGIAGSGKTTAAMHICQQLPYWRYSFAGPLKDAVADLFMLDRERLNEEHYKNAPNDTWGLTPRKIMQLFGTEAMRGTFGKDFWLIQAEERIKLLAAKAVANKLCVVIDDVRFQNEIDFIKWYGGKILYIYRPDLEVARADSRVVVHASEQIIIPNNLDPQEALVCNAFGDKDKFQADVMRIARRWHYENDDLMYR